MLLLACGAFTVGLSTTHAMPPDETPWSWVEPSDPSPQEVAEPEPMPESVAPSITMRATHYGESYEGLRMGCPGAGVYRGSDPGIVAVSPSRYSEWPCGQRLLVVGPRGSIYVTRQDACPGCDKHGWPEMIDLSEAGHAIVCGRGTCVVEVTVL